MNNFLKLILLIIFTGGLFSLQNIPVTAQSCQKEGDPCVLPGGVKGVCQMLLGDLTCIEGQATAPKPVNPCQGKSEGSSCTTTDGKTGACQKWIDDLVCVVGAKPTEKEKVADPCQGKKEGDACIMSDGRTGKCEIIIDALTCTVPIPNPCQGKKEGDPCTLITGAKGVCQKDASGRLGCVVVPYKPTEDTQPQQPAGDMTNREPAGGPGISIPDPTGAGTFHNLLERIARYLFQIGIPIAVIMILYAAFLYMTAGGSEEKVTKAHKALTYAVVGLGILFLAWGITSLVKELLGG